MCCLSSLFRGATNLIVTNYICHRFLGERIIIAWGHSVGDPICHTELNFLKSWINAVCSLDILNVQGLFFCGEFNNSNAPQMSGNAFVNSNIRTYTNICITNNDDNCHVECNSYSTQNTSDVWTLKGVLGCLDTMHSNHRCNAAAWMAGIVDEFPVSCFAHAPPGCASYFFQKVFFLEKRP